MVQQNVSEVSELVSRLRAAQGKKGGKNKFSCKKTTFDVAESDRITVDSWRFQDWDYKRPDLPTHARGLFTTVTQRNEPEIAARGYDKFFNIDEVNDTKWRNIENNTTGPYELSVKENGCIIFISGLEDGTLLVCSKHSTGARADTDLSHAQAGQNWVRRHVASVGRTEKDLARELRRMNVTAVGELCDDSFEEHVLPYSPDEAGVYIHGLNFNLPDFLTLRGGDVHKFADDWGFKKARYLVKNDIFEVKNFLEQCAETGSWDGRDTEGFVVRCQRKSGGPGPYLDWFFKYKFEEPYLMYRQWREATRALIANKPPRYKKHIKITEEYLQYARKQFIQNPGLKQTYTKNHGIIAMRDGFLKHRGLKGSEIIALENAAGASSAPVGNNIVLVPAASIGCGKTTVALALVQLFGWAHVQNDNIEGKTNRPRRFAHALVSELGEHNAVIADRNNHQKRERAQIFADVRKIIPEARFIGLHYVHEPKGVLLDEIRKVTQQRVLDRGDNHQTIQAGTKSESEVISIMEGFLHRFEAINVIHEPDSNFDEVIDLDPTVSSRENLETVVNALYANYPKLMDRPKPSASDLDAAIEAAVNNYTVQTKHDLSFRSNKTQKQMGGPASAPAPPRESPEKLIKRIEYFNISIPPSEIKPLLTSIFSNDRPAEESKLYNHMLNSRRIQPAFHVTLIHRATGKEKPDLWNIYTDAYKASLHKQTSPETTNNSNNSRPSPPLGSARVRLERLIWDARVMAIVARILPSNQDPASSSPLPANLDCWPCANEVPHITIGTADPSIKPKESNDLLKRWLEHGASADSGIWEAEIPSVKVVDGTVGAVMSRR